MGTISQWFHRTVGALRLKTANIGGRAENLAERYLNQNGLKSVARNYLTKSGEIDLIMRDQETLVFVEVRYKKSMDWASPAESVTVAKQQKIIRAAKYYLMQHDKHNKLACRFDVVAMTGDLKQAKIDWLPHAFY